MAAYWMPIIRREDYGTFRGIIGADLPDTYDEWGKLHQQNATNLIKVGHEVRFTEVDPAEFVRFCSARQRATGLKALKDFAMERSGDHY